MPIYEYRCCNCENEFETLVSVSAPHAQCPDCGSEQLTRELSAFASRTSGGDDGGFASGGGGGCCGGACGCGH